jgi:hypothetical protein
LGEFPTPLEKSGIGGFVKYIKTAYGKRRFVKTAPLEKTDL